MYKGARGVKSHVVCDALIRDEFSRSDTYPVWKQGETEVKYHIRGFSQATMEALSALQREPDWMWDRRYQAWCDYQEREPPLWRRTDLSKLRWEELSPYAPPQALDAIQLLVEGFFQPSLDRLPDNLGGLRERLGEAISAKLRGRDGRSSGG